MDEWVVESKLDLNPDFQRGHVWDDAKRRAWLEFHLRGGRTGRVIYLNNPSWRIGVPPGDYNEFVIVDGKQRLEAIRRFVNNELRVFGSYFREFDDNPRVRNTLKVNVNSLKTRAEVLQWYLDFNSGGVVHSEDELARVRELLAKESPPPAPPPEPKPKRGRKGQ